MMDQVVGEKRNGTAAWVLSKPASRPAFIVAKLIPNALGVLVTMVAIPGAVAWVLVTLLGTGAEVLPFLAGLAVIWLALLFYLTLTLMLGTLFDHAGAVVGLALAVLFGQQLVLTTPIAPFLPWALTAPVGQSPVSDASALMLGQPIPAPGAMAVAAVGCIVFFAVAIRRFQRAEL
jgi:ABC-2 type transport system permease protein